MVANTANLSSLSPSEIDALLPVPEPTLTTDFNVSPYYDDYDQDKDYYRILFKPGYAVQARELTQIQTLTQKQIDRFGRHVFKEGSIVIPGEFIIENDVDYVKVRDVDASNSTVTITTFQDQTLVSANNGVQAYVIDTLDGTETNVNTKTIYVRYLNSSNSNTQIKTFQTGDVLVCNAGTLLVSSNSSSIGKGSRFVIREGVYFAKQHFIRFPTQSIILDRYSTSPTCRVGFELVESIVNASDDLSLLDPALESSNYAAPGADRLKLTSILTVRDFNDTEGAPNYVELFKIRDGTVTELWQRTQYSILGEELAKRTLDESGDYYVRGLSIRLRENLEINNNGGLTPNGSANLLSVGVEPGLAYVKGFPVEIFGETVYRPVNKSTTFSNVTSQISSVPMGNYLIANNYTGTISHDVGTTVTLRDAVQRRLLNKVWASGTVTSNTIGTAKVRTIEYDSGTLGTPDGTVAIYLTDISMNGTNSFANVKSISATNFCADPVLENGFTVLKDTASDVLLYFAGAKGIKTIRSANGSPSLSLNFKKTSSVTITDGQFTVSGLTSPEKFPFGNGVTLAAPDKRELILTVDSDIVANTGRGTLTAAGNVITTSVSGGFNNLNNGDKIQFSNNNYAYVVQSIASGDTSLTIQEPSIAFISGNTWSKVYKNGDVIDLTTKGYFTGAVRSVTGTDSILSFNLGETFSTTGKISYPVNRSPCQEVRKVLKANCVVGINTSNSFAGTTGPYPLGVSDVFRIRSITNVATSANLMSMFTLDNGQRDAFYDHARLVPITPLSSGLNIRVVLDYFEPDFTQGKGFFSGCTNSTEGSYPVNDTTTFNGSNNIRTEDIPVYKSPKTGLFYDLRDHLDFRPVKAPTITYTTSTTNYGVNPTSNAQFSFDGTGLRMPVPSTQIQFDYSYFLPRRDILVMDKNKNVFVVEGTPSIFPTTPIVPDDAMLLASIYVSEYPSLARNYAKQIGREDLASFAEKQTNIRFTMRDIGILKRRIENLEYYSSLNLLQKSALDLNIVDGDGNNRFKNGIFVDSFANHLFGQTDSPDYRIVVDKDEKSIRPMYTAESFYYDYLESESENVQKTENLITLPYTEELFLDQAAVTSYRNIELSSYRFVGTLTLDPDIDVWVDTNKLPDEQIKLGPSADNLPQNTVDYNIEKTITGYKVGSPVGKGNGKVSRNYGRGGTGTAVPQDYFGKTTLVSNSNTPNDQPVYAIQQITETTTTTSFAYDEEIVTEGPRIIDVGVVPYIRPQTIDVWGRGLKRATRVYIFFDGENMSQYAAPMTKAQFDLTPDERRKSGFVPQYGAPLDVDADGNVYVALNLPTTGKQFRIGQKEVVITDSPTNSIDATTYSKGYFVASGISKTIQGRVITTGEITSSVDVDVARRNENVFLGYLDNPSCTAYSFLVKAPPEDEGLFLTSIDLFFARKHPTLGVWIEIRAMDNAGGITRTQIPYSEVWKTADEIVISEDGYSNPTNFKFQCPIFLNNNVEYAFVIHTEGLNPDTYLWIARLGETDVRPTALGGGTKYNSRPLTGTFYTTNNNRNWNMVDDIDLKIKFYRANFDTSKSGIARAIFGNEAVERLSVDNSSTFTGYGEPVVSFYRLSLSGNVANISTGDFLVGLTSGANSKVNVISGSVATLSNTNYITGETLLLRYGSNATSSGLTTNITDISYGSSKLSKYSVYRGNVSIDLVGSNGLFKTNEYITGTYTGHKANVASIQNYRYSKINFEPSYLKFRRNTLSFDMKTTLNATPSIGEYFPIVETDSYFFDIEQAIYSRSNEVTDLSGQRSNKVRFTLGSSTNYLSPVIDIKKTRSSIVDNIINANTTYGLEAQSSGGELLNKYISRVVTLAESQDAEDLHVYLTIYRPPTTDVLVWCKLLNANDPDTIETAKWIPMEIFGTEAFSSLTNTDDFREVKYVIPESYLTGPATDNSPGGEVQYTNSQGVKFTGFKYFAIKVGLAGINSAVVPRVLDLRAVALQI